MRRRLIAVLILIGRRRIASRVLASLILRGGLEVPVIELRLAGVFLAEPWVVVAQSRMSLGGLRLGVVLFGVLMLIVVAFRYDEEQWMNRA